MGKPGLANLAAGATTRSTSGGRGRGRPTGKGPQTTDSYAHHIKANTDSPRSPSCDARLPSKPNQNKRPRTTVSNLSDKSKLAKSTNDNNHSVNTVTSDQDLAQGIKVRSELYKNKDTSLPKSPLAASHKMGDKKGNDQQSEYTDKNLPQKTTKEIPPMPPPEAWQQTLEQLKIIGEKVLKLDKIEQTTDKLSQQMESLVDRTTSLENFAHQASTRFSNIETEIASIKETAVHGDDLEGRLQQLKNDIQQENNTKINDLQKEIDVHKTQIQTLKKQSENITKDAVDKQQLLEAVTKKSEALQKETNTQKLQLESLQKAEGRKRTAESSVDQLRQEVLYQKLKDQAFQNRRNLVITALPEQPNLSAYAEAKQFLKDQFNISKPNLDNAYRLGLPPQEGSTYARPLVIAFTFLVDRNQIWRKRGDIKQTQGQKEIHMQLDIPKKLREDLQVLYRVVKAASLITEYKTASIRDYKLHLNGSEYYAADLETLPLPLRPSSIAAPRSDTTLVFFSKFCVLSNHYPAEFTIKDTKFQHVEQYLAVKRAQLSGDENIIHNARNAKQPIEAKIILNSLREDHTNEWNQMVPDIALEGLRAKFKSNDDLANYLCDTEPLILGEASRDKTWGIGLTLDEKDVLDNSKWQKQGNLLGRTLMKIRGELLAERNHIQPT